MSAFLLVPGAPVRALDANGDPASGAKLYVFDAGTSTPVTVYSDLALTTAHATPVVADASGVFAPIYFNGPDPLKVRIDDAADNVLSTLDNLTGLPTGLTGAAETSFSPTAGISADNVQAAIEAVYGSVNLVEQPSIPGLINGNFDIWQRGTSLAAAAGSARYLADLWVTVSAGSTLAPSRQSFTLGQTDIPGEPIYFHRATVVTSAGASNYAHLIQKMEDVRRFAGQTVTLSFYAKADASKNIAIELSQYFGTGGSPSSTVNSIGSQLIALTSSWQRFEVSANIPSISGKTLGTTGDHSFDLTFWFDAGSSLNARTAALGQQSGTFDIAQVQIEPGAVATEFKRRPLGQEIALCERYYETGRMVLASAAYGGSVFLNQHTGRTRKRALPSMTLTADSGTGATLAVDGTAGQWLFYQNATHSVVTAATWTAEASL